MPLPSLHLARLEAEAIHILRETAADFRNPVLLYSIGKDSGALVHLCMKAFWPGKPPFHLLHVDTGWKFRDMIEFRNRMAHELGLDMIVHVNPDGSSRGIDPIRSGSSLHTQVMKTEALRQALTAHGFDAAIGGARRDEERSRAKERVFSLRGPGHTWDPRLQRPEFWRAYNTRLKTGETMRIFPAVELDRARYLALHARRGHSCRPALSRETEAGRGPRRDAHHGRR
jgi:sulfate adenylyltransferase subunit 2